MYALVESHTNVDTTFVAVVSPELQTRAATGNVSGPDGRKLLSRPITFQVMGVIESTAEAEAWVSGARNTATRAMTKPTRASPCLFQSDGRRIML
jgi:hypothetical protein